MRSKTIRPTSPFTVHFLFALCFLWGILGCGGNPAKTPEPGSVHLGNLPQIFLNELGEGALRASLEVYGPNGVLEYSEGLQINEATGEIFSSQFELPRGFTYSFIVTFHYAAPGLPELPVAFVVKVASTEENFLAVFFEESEIMTSNSQLSPQLSASLSPSVLPDLDEDDDGFDNFAEFREQSDPFDPNSIPAAPEIIGEQIMHTQDYVEFSLTFQDASGIGRIIPTDPYICGFYEWKIEDISADGKIQKLTAKFNLHAYADIGDQITFKIQVNDVLGLSRVYDVDIGGLVKTTLPEGDLLKRPQIAILSPSDGETVSDFVTINAIACDEDGIAALSVQGLGLVGDGNSRPDIFDGALDTTSLGDGPQNITLRAADVENHENFLSVQVVIANQNPIKIDVPQPGQVLKDGFTVAAHVDKRLMPNVANLFIEAVTDDTVNRNEIFELNQLKFDVNSLPEAFTGQIFNTANVPNQIFIIRYVAVGSSGEREEREVRYRIDNFPVVHSFAVLGEQGPNACLLGGRVDVAWQVNPLGIGGFVTLEGNAVLEEGDSSNFGNKSNPPPLACDPSVELKATRIGIDQSTGEEKPYTTSKILKLSTLAIADSPEFYDSILPEDFRVEFSVEHNEGIDLSGLQWELYFVNATKNQELPGPITAQGAVIDGGDFDTGILEPRTDYFMTLQLMGPGGQAVSSLEGIPFTTGDRALLGWWRMNGDSFLELGLDSSGLENNASGFGVALQEEGCIQAHCGQWNGAGYLSVPQFDKAETFTLEAWVYWPLSIHDGAILFKKDQFELGVQGGDLVFSVVNDDTIFPEIAYPADSLDPDTWYHLAAVYIENADVDDELQLFINGTFRGHGSNDGLFAPNFKTLLMGTNLSNFLTGQLDEVAIYGRALSAFEIMESCKRSAPGGICPPAPPPAP
ncbi:MAG TPA: hypothetical protein DF383_01320 [Deltaproteobacteria bacterium]|nr:hypothetical protein [Deltaproteobacteria bacterium]